MRVLVTGGRDFDDEEDRGQRLLWSALDRLLAEHGRDELTIIQGGARGADALAAQWCQLRAVPCWTFYAAWERDGASAGPKRNARMVADSSPDLVLAAPGGRGTADMVRRARAAGVEVAELASPTHRVKVDG